MPRNYLAYVNFNLLLARDCGAAFMDWEDMQPFYDRKFELAGPVELHGCWGSEFSHSYRAVEIVHRFGDRVPWREMVSRRYQLDEAGEALEAVEMRDVLKALIEPGMR